MIVLKFFLSPTSCTPALSCFRCRAPAPPRRRRRTAPRRERPAAASLPSQREIRRSLAEKRRGALGCCSAAGTQPQFPASVFERACGTKHVRVLRHELPLRSSLATSIPKKLAVRYGFCGVSETCGVVNSTRLLTDWRRRRFRFLKSKLSQPYVFFDCALCARKTYVYWYRVK